MLGFVSEMQVCQRCQSPCMYCSVLATNCTSCQSGFYLSGFSCAQTCLETFYPNSANGRCDACQTPCRTCSSLAVCKSCVTDAANALKIFYQGQCIGSCPPLVTVQVLFECVDCEAGCAACHGIKSNCSSCQPNYFLYASSCVAQCPAGTYLDQGRCSGCLSPCKTCLGAPTLCHSCLSGYYLSDQSCITLPCPAGTYANNATFTCTKCPNNCLTCNTYSGVCLSCDSASTYAILFSGRCVSACPSDYPILTSAGCVACAEECRACKNTIYECTKCSEGLFLLGSKCLSACPDGYSKDYASNSWYDSATPSSRPGLPLRAGPFSLRALRPSRISWGGGPRSRIS